MGYAAAIIVVLLAVLALLALVQFGLLERRIHYR
jgi:sn-glycerol 3-phosphate transport system permease protein